MKTENGRSRQNREKLLRTALKLFRDRGIDKVSVQDIAAAANLAPATVYNHFGTKQVLVRETFAYYLDSLSDRYRGIMEADVSFEVKLEMLLRAGAESYSQDRGGFVRLMLSEDPEIQRIAKSFKESDESLRWIQEFFEEARRAGAIEADLSIESIIRYSDVIREGVLALARVNEDPVFFNKLLDDITPLYLYGIMRRPDDPRRRPQNDNEVTA